ncbi:MAG: GTPase [Planctomycetota bacterium]
MLDRLDETVVAVSSAPGHGAVGIVRLTGPDAVVIADRMAITADGTPLEAHPASSRVHGEIPIGDGALPADFYLFRAPRSYTRQHLVEIHTVGSPAAVEFVRKIAVSLGARPAEPGEFTARAFLNGAMDLASAEAVARLIRARSDTQLRAARQMMDGALAERIAEVRDALAELLALVEADIDFAEEPIEFISPRDLKLRLDVIAGGLRRLVADAKSAERFNVLPHILFFGPSNAGKSSLMNRLSGTSRAICAAVAGTTRDILSAPIRIGRGEAILLDAAGVDESPDEIIAQARAMVLSAAQRVDLVCVVLDAASLKSNQGLGRTRTEGLPPLQGGTQGGPPLDYDQVIEDPQSWWAHLDATLLVAAPFDLDAFLGVVHSLNVPRIVVAVNKSDLLSAEECNEIVARLRQFEIGPVHPVSALRGDGVEELRTAFANALGVIETTVVGEAMLLSERQRATIADAIAALDRTAALSETAEETIDCADLLAFELREALDALGSVTGAVTTEDLLGKVFANFCIGK